VCRARAHTFGAAPRARVAVACMASAAGRCARHARTRRAVPRAIP
jgi:hypothetical protein